jgi:hypothetical protein
MCREMLCYGYLKKFKEGIPTRQGEGLNNRHRAFPASGFITLGYSVTFAMRRVKVCFLLATPMRPSLSIIMAKWQAVDVP